MRTLPRLEDILLPLSMSESRKLERESEASEGETDCKLSSIDSKFPVYIHVRGNWKLANTRCSYVIIKYLGTYSYFPP